MKPKTVEIDIKGTQPLIFNSGAQINPLSALSKEKAKYTKKRTKTDDDFDAIFAIEMRATTYWVEGKGLYMPVENIQACFHAAAKKRKLGRQAIGFLPDPTFEGLGFAIKCHLSTTEAFFTNPDYMFIKNVNVSGRSVMKCRARIPAGWTMTVRGLVDENMMNIEDVQDLWDIAGVQIGMGDWRPSSPKSPGRNGTFDVEDFRTS